ncbi:efflux RND transporter periplasmic adaptor subunit [Azospirillum thermophilum]|uniref:Efflux transporter periplasmic adaptor subunit n=1 Tax=Azospirillum thermophilum TaxID=2202148 RepID=A0A2S2CXI5_9PROT|nr:efflux RND transporter periplasmic adaptor subunit [Azospirillum thermophilum]AWK89120.1 efflux transporter periplasmic adaptor subunit [Azospirillum thermophilum]
MRRRTGTVVAAVLLVPVIGGGLMAYQSRLAAEPPAPPPAAVKVALAEARREIVPRYYASVGVVEAGRQVLVTAEAAGLVTEVAFDSGQTVTAGQVLVTLNDAPDQARRQRLEALLKNAESQLQRVRELVEERTAPRKQLDQAQAERDSIRAELAEVRALIAQKAIRAPFGGALGIRRVHLGQYLTPGDPIASLSDTSTLYVNFALDERASAEILPGQPVLLRFDAWPEEGFEATVSAVDPVLDEARMLRVQAILSPPDARLRAGMFAEVRVRRPDRAPVVTVPETAVIASAWGDTVFVAQPDGASLTARRVAVKTDARSGGRIEVVDGLRDGDRVVVSGQNRLSDGARVEPAGRDTLAVGMAGGPS